MVKHRKHRRYKEPVGCTKVSVYRKRKGRIVKIKGFIHKKCM